MTAMSLPLRVVMVEDVLEDAELVRLQLRRVGIVVEWIQVDNESAFVAALAPEPDIILCDYTLPQFNAPRALEILKERGSDIPLIVISGTIGEEIAVQTILMGATDYLLKDRLERLGAAIERALELRRLRREHIEAVEALGSRERDYRLLLEHAADGIVLSDKHMRILTINTPASEMLGYTADEVLGRSLVEFIDEDNLREFPMRVDLAHAERAVISQRMLLHKNGSQIPVETSSRMFDDGRMQVMIRDISERKLAEAATAALAAVVSNATDAITGINAAGQITIWNHGAEQLYGYTAEEAMGRDIAFVVPPHLADDNDAIRKRTLSTESDLLIETTRVRKDGTLIDVRMSVTPMRDAGGRITGTTAICHDITDRKRAEANLRRSIELYRTLANNFPNGLVVLYDHEFRIQIAAGAALSRFGLRGDAIEGHTIHDAVPEHLRRHISPPLHAALDGVPSITEVEVGPYTFHLQTLPVRDDQEAIFGALQIAQDITDRKHSERQLQRQMFYDSLTNLPNRALFLNRLDIALSRAIREHTEVVVLAFTLDRLATINESLGHAAGDTAIQIVAERVGRVIRSQDTLARLDGHEFAVLIEDASPTLLAVELATCIIAEAQMPIVIDDNEAFLSTNVGIVVTRGDRGDPESILRDAAAALLRAKMQGRGHFEMFDPSMQRQALRRMALEANLRHAIVRAELQVHYQPIVHLATSAIVGAEALVRWQHPHRGLLAPGAFIPVAEETGLIVEIDRFVLGEACRRAQQWDWLGDGDHGLYVSVNLAANNLLRPDLVPFIEQVLERTGLVPHRLQLELTETILLIDEARTLDTLDQLKALGVRIAIDDFGTGYSSLSYLTQFPVDVVKIDRSFIGRPENGDRMTPMVTGITNLCHALELRVTAEGIETSGQLARARFAGCDEGQGFFFAKPVSAAEFETAARRQEQ